MPVAAPVTMATLSFKRMVSIYFGGLFLGECVSGETALISFHFRGLRTKWELCRRIPGSILEAYETA